MNPLFDKSNWDLVWAEDRGEYVWAYIGPHHEGTPWTLTTGDR